MLRRTLLLIVMAACALLAAAPAQATRWVEGAAGLGDPYYPMAGNGGYDVRHYHLDLDVSDQQLDQFFEVWLYTAAKPTGW